MVISEQEYLNKSDDGFIVGASYIGEPKSNTVMYVSEKD